jgi:DNA mismatch repair protein MutS
MPAGSLSPMMQQYHEAKRVAGEALLLFRMGDFYELFFEDARTAARVLGLSLTSRDKGDDPVPMAGFPHHQLDSYLAKIIAAGHRAAVCEQMEDPRLAKGIVKREVTRIVTPGTVTDDALLDPRASNYLVALSPPVSASKSGRTRTSRFSDQSEPKVSAKLVGMAWVDVSTGRFWAAAFAEEQVADQLARIEPAEVLISDEAPSPSDSLIGSAAVTRRQAWTFGRTVAIESLAKHFGTKSLDGFGFDVEREADVVAMRATGAVLNYLTETQKASLAHIDRLSRYSCDDRLSIDPATRRSLELLATIRDGRRDGSLIGALDRTVTCLGARMLSDWMAAPLTDVTAINARLDVVAELVGDASLTAQVRECLRQTYDIQRLLARVTTGRASPRDLSFVGRTLASLPKVKAKLTGRASGCCRTSSGGWICVRMCAGRWKMRWWTTAPSRRETAGSCGPAIARTLTSCVS